MPCTKGRILFQMTSIITKKLWLWQGQISKSMSIKRSSMLVLFKLCISFAFRKGRRPFLTHIGLLYSTDASYAGEYMRVHGQHRKHSCIARIYFGFNLDISVNQRQVFGIFIISVRKIVIHNMRRLVLGNIIFQVTCEIYSGTYRFKLSTVIVWSWLNTRLEFVSDQKFIIGKVF